MRGLSLISCRCKQQTCIQSTNVKLPVAGRQAIGRDKTKQIFHLSSIPHSLNLNQQKSATSKYLPFVYYHNQSILCTFITYQPIKTSFSF